jgi:hypothetical protein
MKERYDNMVKKINELNNSRIALRREFENESKKCEYYTLSKTAPAGLSIMEGLEWPRCELRGKFCDVKSCPLWLLS